MMDIKDYTALEFVKLIAKHGGGRKAATAIGVGETTFRKYFKLAKEASFTTKKNVTTKKIEATDTPQYFILTSAQDGTLPHDKFMTNLIAYATYSGAEILISGYTYNKSLFQDHSKDAAFFHSSLEPYMTDERIEIGDHLIFCGEMNTLPTAVTPLSGFHNYTGNKSGIFPHPKVQLDPVPVMKGEYPRCLLTTGSITQPNYVPKKAGIKAEYHHIIAAVFVELMPDGTYFVRHLIADDDGGFYDLDRYVYEGEVFEEYEVEAITFGDVHTAKLEPNIAFGCFGVKFMIDFYGRDFASAYDRDFISLAERLNPKHMLFHDVLDFDVRNHHNIADHLHRYRTFRECQTVENEIATVANFLNASARTTCLSVIVESNHDMAFERWLKTADYKADPANAVFFLKSQIQLYENEANKSFSIFAESIKEFLDPKANFLFLREDNGYKVLKEQKGGIECALHGHLGINGARPNYKSFTKLGIRCNVAHAHSQAIYEGVYQAGVMGKLDMGYNKGPSSWSHSHIVVYPNGKRAIITMNSEGEYTSFY